MDGASRLDLESDGLAHQGLHEDLHIRLDEEKEQESSLQKRWVTKAAVSSNVQLKVTSMSVSLHGFRRCALLSHSNFVSLDIH